MQEKFELIEREKEIIDVKSMSPLTWAYIGDCIYDLFIRMNFVNTTNLKPHKLHIETTKYVKAKAQAEVLKKIMEELTDEEKEIVKRGRNTENHHLPKNASVREYMYATAFEALIGYLYLTKQDERLKNLLELCMKNR